MTETITSTELQRNLGVYTDKAMQEPLIITCRGRERLALISIDDFNRLKRLEDREVFRAEDLPEDIIHELEERIAADEAAGIVPTSYKVVKF
ncbi:type II toxin-antitoxin system Phd/YefM family antitoxin [Roseovarius mucosus]|uniref:type II toxin-antitoxin system Phd/YefM family antitoxin n=1 Tax=Roseovarius mucosus TaxID=215743 RepID=UPI0035CED3A5